MNVNWDKIAVPTIVLHSRDDPLVGHETTLWEEAYKNPNVISLVLDRGGHTAYSQGIFPVGPSYTDHVSLDFFAALL